MAHIVWVKCDFYAKCDSLYYRTSDGYEENDIVVQRLADQDQEAYPTLKSVFAVAADGSVYILIDVASGGG